MGPGISPLALKSRDLSVCTLWGGRFFLREIGKFLIFFSLHREILGCLVKFLFFPYRESPSRESPYREIPYRESPIGKVPMGINPKGCLVVWGGGAQRPRLFAASEESVVKTLRPARGKIFLGVLFVKGEIVNFWLLGSHPRGIFEGFLLWSHPCRVFSSKRQADIASAWLEKRHIACQ